MNKDAITINSIEQVTDFKPYSNILTGIRVHYKINGVPDIIEIETHKELSEEEIKDKIMEVFNS